MLLKHTDETYTQLGVRDKTEKVNKVRRGLFRSIIIAYYELEHLKVWLYETKIKRKKNIQWKC